MTDSIAALLGLGLLAASAQAQTATAAPPALSFDIASVQQSKPGAPPDFRLENNRFTANLRLLDYIEFAWDLMPTREQTDAMLAHAPKWVSADRFEIQAVAQGNPNKDEMRLMVRSLLADRFRLQVHTVTAQTAVVALIPDKPGATGPTMRPHSEGQPCNVHSSSDVSRTYAVGVIPPACEETFAIDRPHGAILVAERDVTMKQIATLFTSLGLATRPVVDQTGLSGRFDFTVEYTPERKVQPDDFQATTFQEALRDQLGLKLKATNAPLDNLIVDRAERPSEN